MHFNLTAMDSIYIASEYYKRMYDVGRVDHQFVHLFNLQAHIRKTWGWSACEKSNAIISIDPRSPRQVGFVKAVSNAGFNADTVDYRDYPVSDLVEKVDLSNRLNFLFGQMSNQQGQILITAHHFEIKDALLELVKNTQVGIAFYRSCMDMRWERFGLFHAANCPIKFYDLSPHFHELTGIK